MTWLPLLLADPSPCLRWLVLRDLLGRSNDDPEILELGALRSKDALVSELLTNQKADGAWSAGVDLGLGGGDDVRVTALVLKRLAFCGFTKDIPVVERGAEYLFSQQAPNGSWPLQKMQGGETSRDTYDMVPLQTAIPLSSLAMCGYALDARAERGYEWLISKRLKDGAWPTGTSSGVYGYVAGYRRLAHSRWGCRSNTTGSLVSLSLHPTLKNGLEANRALDMLLAQERFESSSLGFEAARLVGAEKMRGFFTHYAHNDPALLLALSCRIGATRQDDRVDELVCFVLGTQGMYGLWDYKNKPGASCWVTFDLLRTLSHLEAEGDWISLEPRTPLRPYPDIQKRY